MVLPTIPRASSMTPRRKLSHSDIKRLGGMLLTVKGRVAERQAPEWDVSVDRTCNPFNTDCLLSAPCVSYAGLDTKRASVTNIPGDIRQLNVSLGTKRHSVSSMPGDIKQLNASLGTKRPRIASMPDDINQPGANLRRFPDGAAKGQKLRVGRPLASLLTPLSPKQLSIPSIPDDTKDCCKRRTFYSDLDSKRDSIANSPDEFADTQCRRSETCLAEAPACNVLTPHQVRRLSQSARISQRFEQPRIVVSAPAGVENEKSEKHELELFPMLQRGMRIHLSNSAMAHLIGVACGDGTAEDHQTRKKISD